MNAWWKISYYGADGQWHIDCYVRAESERDAVNVHNRNADVAGGEPAIMRDNPGWCSCVDGRPGETAYRVERTDAPVNLLGEPFTYDYVMV